MAKKWWLTDRAIYKEEPEDPQAHKVYRMEREIKGLHKWTVVDESHLNDIAQDACKTFAVKNIPEIYIINKRIIDIGWCDANGIYLNTYRDGQNTQTLIHEVSHWIADDLYPDNEGHGCEWAWIYIELLDRYRMMPRWLSTQLFSHYGIAY